MFELTLKYERGHKTWVAFITGRSRKFGLAREFVAHCSYDSNGRMYLVEPGLYEICEVDQRSFIRVADSVEHLDKTAFVQALKDAEAAQARGDEEAKAKAEKWDNTIDERIARINGEGGFSFN